MSNRDLRSYLDEMVQSQPLQPTPWEDVDRARRAVRNGRLRSALAAGSVVGAVALAAALIWTDGIQLGGTELDVADRGPPPSSPHVPETYVAPDWAPAETDYVPEELTAAEARARCNDIEYADGSPQSSRVEGYHDPIFAGDNVEGYLVGETMTDPDGNTRPAMISCTVPGSWSGDSGSTGSAPTSAKDTAGILLACSNLRQIDLRSWTVAAAMSDGYGGIAASLLSPGQGFYVACQLGPAFEEIWFSNHIRPVEWREEQAPEQLGASSGRSCYPSAVECAGQVYSWAFVLPERPAADAESLEDIDAVRAAMAQLAPRQRATIVMRYWLDLSVAQTAAELGCSAGTVKSQTAKAMIVLRRALDEPQFEGEEEEGGTATASNSGTSSTPSAVTCHQA